MPLFVWLCWYLVIQVFRVSEFLELWMGHLLTLMFYWIAFCQLPVPPRPYLPYNSLTPELWRLSSFLLSPLLIIFCSWNSSIIQAQLAAASYTWCICPKAIFLHPGKIASFEKDCSLSRLTSMYIYIHVHHLPVRWAVPGRQCIQTAQTP